MFKLILSLFLLFTFGNTQTNKIDGTWKLTVETSAGTGTPTMVLKQNGETEITGTYTGRFGELPVKGKRDGNKFTISFEVQGMEITYSGTLDGDNMSGTLKLGDMGDGKFTGKRQQQ